MIYQGSTYKNLDSLEEFRVVYINGNDAYTISLDSGKVKEVPKRMDFTELMEMFNDGIVVPIPDRIRKSQMKLDLEEPQYSRRDKRYSVFKNLWEDDFMRECLFDSHGRKLFYQTVAGKLGICFAQAQVHTTRFLRGGCSPNSLLDEKGIKTRGTQKKGKKTGPKTAVPGEFCSDQDRENCRESYKKIVLKGGKTVKKAFDYCNRTFYMERVECEGKKSFHYTGKKISWDQFLYHIEPVRDKYKEQENKVGRRDMMNNHTPVKGNIRGKLIGPGSRVEIDATHYPLNLVCRDDRTKVVGKPLLYIAMDVYTGMIAGFVLSFENESWRTTALLIKNIIADKVEYCHSLGLYYVRPEDWPFHHLPRLIFGDNGKNNSSSLEKAFEDFPVDLKFGKSYKSTDKPYIERKHSRIKSFAKDYLPGAVKEKMKSRGTTDPKLKASLTLDELEVLIAETIIEFNRHCIDGYARTPDMILKGVKPCPNDLWQYAASEGKTELISLMPDEVELLNNKLLTKADKKNVLNRTGIRFKKFKFLASSEKDYDLWQAHIGEKVDIRYNLLDCTYVYFELEKETVCFELSDDYSSFRGLSWAEVDWIRKQGKADEHNFRNEDYEVDANLDYLYEEAAKEAERGKQTDC